jgi:phage-related holin
MVQPKGYKKIDYKKLDYKKSYMGWSKQVPCLYVVAMEWEDWWFSK